MLEITRGTAPLRIRNERPRVPRFVVILFLIFGALCSLLLAHTASQYRYEDIPIIAW